MSVMKMTLIGMYNFDNTLFANLSVPTGIDRDLLIKNILMRGGEYEVLYADLDFMKLAIGQWSDKWQDLMKKWVELNKIEYNPLENYDRKEDWVDNNAEKTARKENAVASDFSKSTGHGTTDNDRSAYNSTGYQPHDMVSSDTSGTNNSIANTDAHGETNTQGNSVHSGRIHGNIGVKTTQSMYLEQLDVIKINIYEELSEMFLTELVIYVY